jgi:hypothetical protein
MVKMKFSLQNILYNLRLRVPRERHFAWEHNIYNYAHRPYIDFHIVFLQKDFWSDVVRRPIHRIHSVLLWEIFGKPKVNHFYASQITYLGQHEVFWFDVPMRDLLWVQIFQSQEELFHDISWLLFRQVFLLNNVMEKLSTLAKLKDQETNIVPLPNLVKFDNIGVIL